MARLEIVNIIDAPRPVSGAPGIIYSTNPQMAVTERGKCILKNHNPAIVFAEAVCYSLANIVNLAVPECYLCRDGTDGIIEFGSLEKECRFPIDIMLREGKVSNPNILPHTIVFDVWVCNIDRNLGNFVATIPDEETGKFKLFAIDFEKSEVCRGKGSLTLAGIEPTKCWPTETLGILCKSFQIPREFCDVIGSLDDSTLEEIVNAVSSDLRWQPDDHLENCIFNLKDRKRKLNSLVQEAWSV